MSKSLLISLVFAALCCLGLAYVGKNDPSAGGGLFPRCMFHDATELYCPGCGGTRAAHALANFRIGEAFRQNLLLMILAALFVWAAGLKTLAGLSGRSYRGPRFRFPVVAAYFLPLVVVLFWILRNIPGWPFELLAPR